MFDAWRATIEEAATAQKTWDDAGKDGPAGPIYQWSAAQRVEAERKAAESGDGFAVLACINLCVTHELVAPEWLAYAFNRHYYKVLNCKVGSWDDAFGKLYAGKHVEKLAQRRRLRFPVHQRVTHLHADHYEPGGVEPKLVKGVPIDEVLFERVGEEFGVGKTLCSELYYEALSLMSPNLSPRPKAKRGRAKKRIRCRPT